MLKFEWFTSCFKSSNIRWNGTVPSGKMLKNASHCPLFSCFCRSEIRAIATSRSSLSVRDMNTHWIICDICPTYRPAKFQCNLFRHKNWRINYHLRIWIEKSGRENIQLAIGRFLTASLETKDASSRRINMKISIGLTWFCPLSKLYSIRLNATNIDLQSPEFVVKILITRPWSGSCRRWGRACSRGRCERSRAASSFLGCSAASAALWLMFCLQILIIMLHFFYFVLN